MTSGKQYIVRLISSEDHAIPKEELLQSIKDSGTDRYDPDRKLLFDDFYEAYKVDFFGVIVEEEQLEERLQQLKKEFGSQTMGDRQRYVEPDIAILYNAAGCEMIEHVYDGRLTSDCFRFVDGPKNALEGVRAL